VAGGTAKGGVQSITYANVIVEKSSSFLEMNYREVARFPYAYFFEKVMKKRRFS
jgi:hypothetical protein